MHQTENRACALEPVAARKGEGGFGVALLRWVGRTVPTALVLAVMGGLAYWGHHTEWTFKPGHGRTQQRDEGSPLLWSDEVGGDAARLSWCSAHGVCGCPTCRPENAQVAKPPAATAEDEERVRKALTVRIRPKNDPSCLSDGQLIRFASAEAVEKAGVEITPAWQTAVVETVTGGGEVAFDPTRVARLSARLPGTAWWVARRVGDPVKAGDVVALIDAADLGKTKIEMQQALVQVRLKAKAAANLKNSPVPERQKREADAALRDAEVRLASAEQALVNLSLPVRTADFQKLSLDAVAERLQALGLPEAVVESVGSSSVPATLLPVRAPFDGLVLQADVIAGEAVDPAKTLFVVADPRRLWLTLNVNADDARWLAVGQPVRFRPDGGPAEVTSRITWIGKSADEKTRTVPLRADLANDDGSLRAFTFGLGKVVLREEAQAVVVPAEAVQEMDGCRIVFVRDKDFLKPDGPKVFYPRAVRVGAKDGGNVEIIVGVLPGEVVATKGSRLLLDELRKDRVARGTEARR